MSAQILRAAVPKSYAGFPHGMPTTDVDRINADLISFIAGEYLATFQCAAGSPPPHANAYS